MSYSEVDKADQRLTDAARRAARVLRHYEAVSVRVDSTGLASVNHCRLDIATSRMTFRQVLTPDGEPGTARDRALLLLAGAQEVYLDTEAQLRLW